MGNYAWIKKNVSPTPERDIVTQNAKFITDPIAKFIEDGKTAFKNTGRKLGNLDKWSEISPTQAGLGALAVAGLATGAGLGGRALMDRRRRGLATGSRIAKKGLPFKSRAQLAAIASQHRVGKNAILSGYAREMAALRDPEYKLTKAQKKALYKQIRKELAAKLR